MIRIISFAEATTAHYVQMAALLQAAFPQAEHWRGGGALEEVKEFADEDRLAFLALEGNYMRGWIGGILCSATMCELHPLVVEETHRRQGLGQRLVQQLEQTARACGCAMIWLGTDDDFGGTNLYGKELYPNVLQALARIQPTSGHPYTFYQRLGYHIVGVLPDAGGFGKPDILMAKRL